MPHYNRCFSFVFFSKLHVLHKYNGKKNPEIPPPSSYKNICQNTCLQIVLSSNTGIKSSSTSPSTQPLIPLLILGPSGPLCLPPSPEVSAQEETNSYHVKKEEGCLHKNGSLQLPFKQGIGKRAASIKTEAWSYLLNKAFPLVILSTIKKADCSSSLLAEVDFTSKNNSWRHTKCVIQTNCRI